VFDFRRRKLWTSGRVQNETVRHRTKFCCGRLNDRSDMTIYWIQFKIVVVHYVNFLPEEVVMHRLHLSTKFYFAYSCQNWRKHLKPLLIYFTCKTVCLMLSDRCLYVCLPVLSCTVLSVTLVYCGQTVGRITMKLGMQVGLGPRFPSPKEDTPNFRPISVVAKWLDRSRCHLTGR